MLIFLSYSGLSGILGSERKQNADEPYGCASQMHFTFILMDRLYEMESSVSRFCRFFLFLRIRFPYHCVFQTHCLRGQCLLDDLR